MSGSVDLGGRRIIKKIFFKQKTAYEIVTGDWSSDVCSSDLLLGLKRLRWALKLCALHWVRLWRIQTITTDQAMADVRVADLRSTLVWLVWVVLPLPWSMALSLG